LKLASREYFPTLSAAASESTPQVHTFGNSRNKEIMRLRMKV
jgi:hypothetical protein